ncbi:MAG: hypothetical protein OXE94_04745 [Aestuariivita sp.]|nr:hypothetical protein [Aestuariivita sp.]MCY4201245.1 hypothetical protein [Aestuariivita sp.]
MAKSAWIQVNAKIPMVDYVPLLGQTHGARIARPIGAEGGHRGRAGGKSV